MSIVLGKGINDVKGSSRTWQYCLWMNMLKRCYANNNGDPSYIGCEVSEQFLTLSNFIAWVNKFGKPLNGWCLDKDLLGNGRLYSEDTCCFLPSTINLVFKSHNYSAIGLLPGVSQQPGSGRFKAKRSMYGKVVCLGTFSTQEEAHQAYVVATENYVHELAEEYKDLLAANVYEALKAYSI
jgi:hypothetical protein